MLKGCACTSVSEPLTDGWRHTSKTTSTLPLCQPTYSTVDKTDSTSCANVLLFPFILCTRPIPSMIQVDGVVIASAGDTFFSISLASAALFVFHRNPSAFATFHSSGSSGCARTSFMFTRLLSATRIIWLKRFRSALRTILWPFIRDVFVLIVENVFSLSFVILS